MLATLLSTKMAAPVPARPRANFQEVFKFTLLSVGLIVIACLVSGVLELRDLGWTPSSPTLYAENKSLREQIKTLKNGKMALENEVQKLKKQLETTTDEKNEHFVDATICANSKPSSCWWSIISAMLIGFFFGMLAILCCCCYHQIRYRERGAVVAYRD